MIEAMKQALEALEQVTKELLAVRDELAERGARPTTNVFHQRLWNSSFSAYTDHAIPAAQSLRKAIAELESQEPDKYEMDIECTKCGAKQSGVLTVNTHPPQRTEQEPVQVSPLEFVEMVMEKEHLIGKPIFWAEWPNKEKNT